jgi:carbon monoxide dehydrogenase subunit G
MPRGAVSVTIRRPIGDVFAILSDVDKTSTWHPAAIEEHWTSEGPVGVGSTRKAVGKAFGIRSENEAEVTVFEPHRALGLKSISGPVPYEISIDLEPVDEDTKIDWVTEMKPEGLYKPIVSLTFGVFMRQLERGLQNLKDLMESGKL